MNSPPPDDPFAPSDATILRPRPGRRPAGAPQPAAPVPPSGLAARQSMPPAGQAGAGASLEEFISAGGLNPLVQAAVPLLVLAGRLRGQIANADVESLRRQCVQEVRAFEDRARNAGIAAEDVLAARYALCTVIDEAVLNTPWGAQSGWAGQSLLVTFHREAAGGEKFFQILDRLLGEPQRYVALIELLYVCLALGFEGRYRLDPRGAAGLAEVRQNLYRRIETLRGRFEPGLSPQWKGVEDRRNAVLRLLPLWVVAAACAVLLAGAYIFFNARLSERSRVLNATLAGVGIERLEAATPARIGAPPSGLATLLAPQINQGLVSVEEQGERSVITITTPDLFASGSARINSRYESLVHEIGAAANRVPGRIIVTGHTDDQPVRSFQYHDNYELSRARAVQVASLLKYDIPDASRIESAGRGDSDPRYKPADLPENRARNRRVEIVHRRDN
ncbi:MAG: rane protein [Gammaproteobacteria bacterium]|nr:rane protein [Gammaproteobacteria bacterium]